MTLILGEAALRGFLGRELGRPPADAERSAEHLFWRRDAALGIPGLGRLYVVHYPDWSVAKNLGNGLPCPCDEHFCERGDQWLATHILQFLEARR
ncbi:MAG TPA: hypothetical protein VGV60_01110 [Candidatus Polarisedimenticolia bacterium]|jgi:hypothetical protein|nr:hypothetical protein [Candidatus Polarisedimenticolia bacterium]